MKNILIAGAGKIGRCIACLLVDSGQYKVHLIDKVLNDIEIAPLLKEIPELKVSTLDTSQSKNLTQFLEKNNIHAVISCLPYFINQTLASAAKGASAHYFDLTEDISTVEVIKKIASNAHTAFVPQCGLAPGFVGIAANSLIQEFDQCQQAQLRVGALPQYSNNPLHYALTWSIDGLINIYANPCHVIEKGKMISLPALEGLESVEIDGCAYEAFYTSGGLGHLGQMYENKIDVLNYKTLRYPGHREKIHLLMNELGLKEDRETLKRILEQAIPTTNQDVVLVYISVTGTKNGQLLEKSIFKKILPTKIRNFLWSAIQVSTASGACAVLDIVLKGQYKGFVVQEQIPLGSFLKNDFGRFWR